MRSILYINIAFMPFALFAEGPIGAGDVDPIESPAFDVNIGTVEWNGQVIQYDKRWSLNNWSQTKLMLANIPPGTTIYASVLSQEEPDTEMFDPRIDNVTLIECARDNVLLPAGVTAKEVYREPAHRIKVQNDIRDWIIDKNDKPVTVVNEEYWKEKGLSVDPKDIPAEPIDNIGKIKKVSTVPIVEEPIP